jgi:hypothetical protein
MPEQATDAKNAPPDINPLGRLLYRARPAPAKSHPICSPPPAAV